MRARRSRGYGFLLPQRAESSQRAAELVAEPGERLFGVIERAPASACVTWALRAARTQSHVLPPLAKRNTGVEGHAQEAM
ncbi:hypothetical protein MTO96_015241 [Rhipicephalus appendiculatus]